MACASAKSLLSSSSGDWNWMCSAPALRLTPAGRSGNRWHKVSGSDRDGHTRTGLQAADGVQPLRQALLAPPLHLEIGTIADLFQLRDQLGPVDQECPASLIPAEAADQVDGAPPAQAEQALAHGTVHHRHIQRRQFRQDLGDAKQPLRFSGHPAGLSVLPALFLPAHPGGVQQHVMDFHPKAAGLGVQHLAQQQLPIPLQAHGGAAFDFTGNPAAKRMRLPENSRMRAGPAHAPSPNTLSSADCSGFQLSSRMAFAAQCTMRKGRCFLFSRSLFSTRILSLLVPETILIFSCYILAAYWVGGADPSVFLLYDNGLLQIALVVAGVLVGLQLNKLYAQVGVRSKILLFQQLCLTLGVTFLLESLLSYLRIPELVLAPTIMMLGSALTWPCCWSGACSTARCYGRACGRKRVLFYGTNAAALEAGSSLAAHPELGLSLAGYIDDDRPAGTPLNGARVLGSTADLARVVSEVRPDRIVVGVTERRRGMPFRELLDLQFRGIEIQRVAELYEAACERVCVAELLPSQLIFSDELGARRGAIALQAIYSNIVALAGLALLAVLLLPIAVAIKLSSRGPVVEGRLALGREPGPIHALPLPLPARGWPTYAEWAPGCAGCIGRAAATIERDPRRNVAGGTASAQSGVHPGLDGANALLWAAACCAPRHPGLEPAQLRLRAAAARRAGVAGVRPVLHQAHVSGAGRLYCSAQLDGGAVSGGVALE
jgi:hypothetical protein